MPKFIIGPIAQYTGLYTLPDVAVVESPAGGGMGRLVAELIMKETPFVDPAYFAPERFGKSILSLPSSRNAVQMHGPTKKEDNTLCATHFIFHLSFNIINDHKKWNDILYS